MTGQLGLHIFRLYFMTAADNSNYKHLPQLFALSFRKT